MSVLFSFIAVLGLAAIAWIGKLVGLEYLFGVVVPYLAFATFLGGFVYRVLQWAKSPVPFRIPTTCGQEYSLPWIKQDKLDCPTTKWQVVGRMILEVVLFRSLFRNKRSEIREGPNLAYGSSKWLWLFGLMFHYSFLVIVIRHMRLFTIHTPAWIDAIEGGDSFLEIGLPVMYITDVIFILGITLLFLRRVLVPRFRYISHAADYFPLFLLFGIGTTGILMRYLFRVDVIHVKELATSLATFSPYLPKIGTIFFIHLFLVCSLLAYFPFSKLMHMGGIFLSPTRNMANNSRMVRHINPWNDPAIQAHSYAAYEDEFRDLMKEAGIPVEKE